MTPDLTPLAVYIVGLLTLVFIELRLRALFARHEVKEEKLHATSQLVSDAAAATAREATRHINEIRIEVAAQRINVANLGELLRDQEGRLGAVETRLMRAALAVPHPSIREGM